MEARTLRATDAVGPSEGDAVRGVLEGTLEIMTTAPRPSGSAKQRGLEPDECCCRGPLRDVPELAIEVLRRHGGIEKLDVYAGLEVPEVWFFEKGALAIHVLEGGRYVAATTRTVLPPLDVKQLSAFVRRAIEAGPAEQTAVVRAYRDALRG